MRITERTRPTTPGYFEQMVLEAIADVEAGYEQGLIDHFSYYQRSRALKRMLR